MSARLKAAAWVVVLTAATSVLIWHVVTWHTNGTYLEMYRWAGTGKGYLTAFYNLAVMLLLGILLGVLMDRVGVIAGRGGNREKPTVGRKAGNGR